MNEAFGMMDEGYFKPRSDILKFVNDLLQVNVTKIESLGQGAVYCQILDAMFPGKVPLSKVNWKARLDWEFVNNLKVLQSAFTKIGIKKVIELEKLSKCKYQDNLEMIQWLMRFYECNGNRPFADYDAVARRKGAEPNFSYADKIIIPKIFNLATPKLDNEKAGQAGTGNSSSKTKQDGVEKAENENNSNKQAGIKQTDKVKIVKEKNNNLNKNDIAETKHTATQAGLKVIKPESKVKGAVEKGKKEIKNNLLTMKQPSSQADSLKLQQIKDVMSMNSLSNTGKLSQIAGILGVFVSNNNQGQQHQNGPDSDLTHANLISKVINNEQHESDQENANAQEEHNDPESHLGEQVGHDLTDLEGEEEGKEQEEIGGEEEEESGEHEDGDNLHDQEEQQQVEEQDEEGNIVEGTTPENLQSNNLKISPEEEKISGKLSAEIQDIDGLLDNLIDSNDHDLLHSGHDQEEGDEVI